MRKLIALLVVLAFVAITAFAEDAKPAAAPAAVAAPMAKSLVGTILSFKADATKKTLGTLVVVGADKKQIALIVLANASILDAKNKVAEAKILTKGKKVTVDFIDNAGKEEATKIVL